MKWKLGVSAGVMVLATTVVALGQEQQRRPSPYFECPYVNYFDPGCPQLRELPTRPNGPPPADREVPLPPPGTPDAESGRGPEEARPRKPDIDELYPLFPRESLAPDAPPMLRLLLADPTLENARRYVRWYARRSERLRAVQTLIDLAGRERQ